MPNRPKPKTSKKSQKSPTKRHKVWLCVGIFLSLLCLVFIGISYLTLFAKTDRPAKTLVVGKGDTYHSLLVNNHWQTRTGALPILTRLYLKMHAKGTLETGAYNIPAGASLKEVVAILSKGAETAMIKIQLIEGKTVKELYHTLKSTDGVVLETLSPKSESYTWQMVKTDNQKVQQVLKIDGESFGEKFNGNLEGLFAPNTYYFAKGTTDTAILQKLYNAQQAHLKKAWQAKTNDLPYKTPYELLIMASIVERETGVADERAKVASVFVNRLRQNMRLQTDPTIIYGLFDRYDGTIYRSNINEKTDYNTYQIDGLPPTPIAMPSLAALMAAANPQPSDALYFVATGHGGHTFSNTLEAHNKAVEAYRKTIANK